LLSKVLPDGEVGNFKLRSQEFLDSVNIEYILNKNVKSIDAKSKSVSISDGSKLSYNKLCIATGANPRKPPIKGVDLENVVVLRSGDDQESIKNKVKNMKSVVVVGASFIGTEAAASLKMKYKDKLEIHVIDNQEFPL